MAHGQANYPRASCWWHVANLGERGHDMRVITDGERVYVNGCVYTRKGRNIVRVG